MLARSSLYIHVHMYVCTFDIRSFAKRLTVATQASRMNRKEINYKKKKKTRGTPAFTRLFIATFVSAFHTYLQLSDNGGEIAFMLQAQQCDER